MSINTTGRVAMLAGLFTAIAAAPATVFADSAPARSDHDLPTMAGTLHLPFAFQLTKQYYVQNRASRTMTTQQKFEITPTEGPLKGAKLGVYALNMAQETLDAGQQQAWVRTMSENALKEKGTRDVRPLSLDGFGFYVIDEMTGDAEPAKDAAAAKPEEKKKDSKPERVVYLLGNINATTLMLGMRMPADTADTAFARDALRAFQLDYKQLLGQAGAFSTEQGARVKDNRMQTAVGAFAPPSGSVPRLFTSSMQRDGKGAFQARSTSFNMGKVGFWTLQGLNLHTSCSLPGVLDEEARKEIVDWPGNMKGASIPSASQPMSLGGVEGSMRTATRMDAGSRVDLTHWYGSKAGTDYELQLTRVNGKGNEKELLKQLAAASFSCTEGGSYGTFAIAPAVAPAPVASQPAATAPVLIDASPAR